MVVKEGIRKGVLAGIDFGDYTVTEKLKVADFEADGHAYYVKTHGEVTRLEKNGSLLLETVPGAAIHAFVLTEAVTTFDIEGQGSTMVTVELEPECGYKIYIEDVYVDLVETQVSGKVSFSLDLTHDTKKIRIEKVS